MGDSSDDDGDSSESLRDDAGNFVQRISNRAYTLHHSHIKVQQSINSNIRRKIWRQNMVATANSQLLSNNPFILKHDPRSHQKANKCTDALTLNLKLPSSASRRARRSSSYSSRRCRCSRDRACHIGVKASICGYSYRSCKGGFRY
jgi:hypothetical protein